MVASNQRPRRGFARGLLLAPVGDPLPDPRPQQALEEPALVVAGERALGDRGPVDGAAGRDLRPPAVHDGVADLGIGVELVHDGVGRQRRGAEAAECRQGF